MSKSKKYIPSEFEKENKKRKISKDKKAKKRYYDEDE